MKREKSKKEPQEESKQLDLGIKEPFKNRLFKIKRSIDFAVLRFEVRKFLKDPLVWATLVIGLVLIAQQVYLILENLSDLPVYVPIFRYFLSAEEKLTQKDYIFIFPLISIITLLLSMLFTSRYYNNEKKLTRLLLFSSLLSSISQSLILIDLINLF
jgi:ABC-type multidrug transport system permease subunit